MKNYEHPSRYEGMGPLFDSKLKYPKGPLRNPEFDGDTYEQKFDATRLRGEMARVYRVMSPRVCGEGFWFTLLEISELTGDPEASISARLRDLRKAKFGGHTVNRRRRGDPRKGIFEYQLL